MAYNVKRINPLDFEPRKAIGVSLPFSGGAVFNSTFLSKDAIKTNLINLLLTGTGERYFNPGLGAGLRDYIFENIDEANLLRIKSQLRQNIEIYFPTIKIINLNLSSDPDSNTINFYLRYQVIDTDIDDEITINVY